MRVLKDFKKLLIENTSLTPEEITLKQLGRKSPTGLEIGLVRYGSSGYSNYITLGTRELIRQEVMLQVLFESKDSYKISDAYEEIELKLGTLCDFEGENYIFRYIEHLSGPLTLAFDKEGRETISANYRAIIDRKV